MTQGWKITVRGMFSASNPFLRLWRFKKTDLDGTWFVIVDQPAMATCIIDVAKTLGLHGISSPIMLKPTDKPKQIHQTKSTAPTFNGGFGGKLNATPTR